MDKPRDKTFADLVQDATNALGEIVTDESQSAGDRIRAATAILDRALGKPIPMQIVDEKPLIQMELNLVVPDSDEPKKVVVNAKPRDD